MAETNKTNRIQIRHGKVAPTAENLLQYELGIADDTKLLYFKGSDDKIHAVGADPEAITDQEIIDLLNK